jgi:hypothetical protein
MGIECNEQQHSSAYIEMDVLVVILFRLVSWYSSDLIRFWCPTDLTIPVLYGFVCDTASVRRGTMQ